MESTSNTTYAIPYSRLTVWLVLLFAFGIIGLWLAFTPGGVLGKADAVGYAICHRIEVRSFVANGRPLPLCARCTGIYLGVMTGLGVFAASGRLRAARLYSWQVGAVLFLFVAVMGIDGLNSYFHLFPGFTGLYEPRNWLRLTTGVFCGLTLISVVFPIFNQSMWRNGGDRVSPIGNLKELAGLSILAGLVVLLTLTQNATILLALGLISALGTVIVLTMMMTVAFVTATNRYRSYTAYPEMALALLAGLTMAITMIGLIDFARFQVTGTWGGFVF